MTGKVFEESVDVYQDQAKVLFDYYREAAERIVGQEMDIERRMGEVQADREKAEAAVASTKRMMIVWAVAAGLSLLLVAAIGPVGLVGTVAFGILAFMQYSESRKQQDAMASCDQMSADLQRAMGEIRRDYRVEKVGVAYVPVARRVAVGDKSFVVDYTGDQDDTEFSLTLLNQPEELREAMNDLQRQMGEMPAIESNEEVEQVDTSDYSTSLQDVTLHDYMGSIDRQIRTVRYLVEDNRSVSVSVPVIAPSSQRHRLLAKYATSTPGSYPVIPVFNASAVQRKVEQFSELGAINQQSIADGSGDVRFFVDVMRRLAHGVDLLARSRAASVSQLVSYSSGILANVLKAPFDQYSPVLEAEEIERIRVASFNYADEADDYRPFSLKESSRVRYDIFSDVWVAENGTRTAMPFGMHQVDAEVLMPVIANLMQENRRERLRIYADIQNQKNDYLNQWHRDTDDFFGRNRTEANALIQRMNEAYAEFVESYTNYQQQHATMETMRASGNLKDAEVAEAQNQDEIVAGFQVQTNQARAKQDEFTAFMERIREDIDLSAERFGHVEYYEASLRDAQARANARAASGVGDLDQRRRGLASINPYLAQNGVVPPEPRVSERLDEDFTINLGAKVEQDIGSIASRASGSSPSAGKAGETA